MKLVKHQFVIAGVNYIYALDEYDRVQINSKETMDTSLKENLLYVYSEGEDKIGLIAGENELFLGKPAIYQNEILIGQQHRGQGYANKLLAGFVNILNADYFICDIDADNIPSTNIALRSGQRVFSQEIFVAI